jgi:hypothetical protein
LKGSKKQVERKEDRDMVATAPPLITSSSFFYKDNHANREKETHYEL